MMISPNTYMGLVENLSYRELIRERDRLIRFIRKFEKKEKAGDRSGKEWCMHPSAEVRYQMYMEYLAELIIFMKNKYNEEYVWGDKKLSESE